MARALRMAPEWFLPPAEKAKAEADKTYVASEALIAPLSLMDRELTMNLAMSVESTSGSLLIATLRGGLRNVRNVVGLEKFPVDAKGRPTDEALEQLPQSFALAVAREIRERSTLSEEERGNSV